MLALLHFDWPNQRQREDHYYMRKMKRNKTILNRFYTTIKLFSEGKKYNVFEHVKDASLPSPKGCMITPTGEDMFSPLLFQNAKYIGMTNISYGRNSIPSVDPFTQLGEKTNISAYHWRILWGNNKYEYFESYNSERSLGQPVRKPLRIETPHMNVTILQFKGGSDTIKSNLFSPTSLTSDVCTPVGTV
jgi:hypothetical protein